MSNEKTTLEIIAPTTEEAIERGLDQLGLPLDAVQIEVLDSGSHGLFGLGGRQARVRLTIGNEEPVKKSVRTRKPERKAESSSSITSKSNTLVLGDDHELEIAKVVVEELLEKMRITARVTTSFIDIPEKENEKVINIDIQGDDLSILIGRRSETLNALQYICTLIITKELGKWVSVLIDVQGYRSRRERQLRQLAKRMADQAINTGKRQVLEPMPANERRIIHMELRESEDVTTESIGEEPNRKITISPKIK